MKLKSDPEKIYHNKFYKDKPDGGYMKNKILVKMFYLYLRLMLSSLEKHIDLEKCKILSLGSGTGRLEFELASRVKKVVGIDISDVAIRIANKENKFCNVSFKCASVTDLPFANESFDIVISLATIHHVKDQKLILREISRVLKTQGVFYAIEPNSIGLLHNVSKAIFSKTYNKFHSPDESPINPQVLKINMVKNGLREVKVSYCDYFLVPLAFLVSLPSFFSDLLYLINRSLTILPLVRIYSAQFCIIGIKK